MKKVSDNMDLFTVYPFSNLSGSWNSMIYTVYDIRFWHPIYCTLELEKEYTVYDI